MTDHRPWLNGLARVTGPTGPAMPRCPARHLRGNPTWRLGGMLAIALLIAGCSSPGTTGRAALLGVPLPGLSSKSGSDDAAFRKRVEKDPFPSAGSSLAKSGPFAGLK